jgi:hypothetical protein
MSLNQCKTKRLFLWKKDIELLDYKLLSINSTKKKINSKKAKKNESDLQSLRENKKTSKRSFRSFLRIVKRIKGINCIPHKISTHITRAHASHTLKKRNPSNLWNKSGKNVRYTAQIFYIYARINILCVYFGVM